MTENKRFELAYEKGNWWAVRDGDITLWKEEVIHLLNELSEENEKLKQKEYLGIPATGTLKNSVPNDPIDAALKLHEYKNAHDYKDEEFPKPLQKRRE